MPNKDYKHHIFIICDSKDIKERCLEEDNNPRHNSIHQTISTTRQDNIGEGILNPNPAQVAMTDLVLYKLLLNTDGTNYLTVLMNLTLNFKHQTHLLTVI